MVLTFTGAAYFRQRIVCATLSGKPILIKDIRVNDPVKPGLRDYEASLLRLMDKLTNGCKIEIDVTGTSVHYKPGILINGKISHDCGKTRAVGYFLEALVMLGPFGKQDLLATLTGITNHTNNLDLSVDLFRTVTLPNLLKFGLENIDFKIKARGAPPLGGGQVIFTCPMVKSLKQIKLVDSGKVKRIRGIAYTSRMNPVVSNRVKDKCKERLLQYVPDVFIYTDHYKGKESGQSPGYGLSLVAETTTGCFMSYELMGEAQTLPEDLADNCSKMLLHEILQGGCIDTSNQAYMLLFMVLGSEDVSKIQIGKLSPYSIAFLRNIREFFGVTFQILPEPETKTSILTCFGCGFKNLSRQVI